MTDPQPATVVNQQPPGIVEYDSCSDTESWALTSNSSFDFVNDPVMDGPKFTDPSDAAVLLTADANQTRISSGQPQTRAPTRQMIRASQDKATLQMLMFGGRPAPPAHALHARRGPRSKILSNYGPAKTAPSYVPIHRSTHWQPTKRESRGQPTRHEVQLQSAKR
uniref:Uncharacterized protein n=1 Tax=Eutreptiella gymnastica TaxID=73025 RepID=A0A7S4G082_9EUGL